MAVQDTQATPQAKPQVHTPQTLDVYILVVPLDKLPPCHSGATLNEEELEAAHKYIKSIGADSRLQQTDIVVVYNLPASLVDVQGAAQQLGQNTPKTLVPHDPAGHHETLLRVWSEPQSDRIRWRSDQPFTITNVTKSGTIKAASERNPFHGGPPYVSAPVTNMFTSSTILPNTQDQQYKISISINGQLVDPDFICGTPPPP